LELHSGNIIPYSLTNDLKATCWRFLVVDVYMA